MAKYRKKPVVMEAIQWTGSNLEEVRNFVGSDLIEDYVKLFNIKGELKKSLVSIAIEILGETTEVDYGDYIIKYAHGDFNLCKSDIFEQTYEEIVENGNLD